MPERFCKIFNFFQTFSLKALEKIEKKRQNKAFSRIIFLKNVTWQVKFIFHVPIMKLIG